MIKTHKTEGIVLHTLPFREYDQILTVFTEQEGTIKFIVKGAYRSQLGKGNSTAPLTQAEFVYSKGKSELYKCVDTSVICQHLHLRENLHLLQSACDMLQAVTESQLLHQPAPLLYRLLLIYLIKLPQVQDPFAVSSSFRLKILRLEGVFNENDKFSELSEEENLFLILLAFCQNFQDLIPLILPPALPVKIKNLFKERL